MERHRVAPHRDVDSEEHSSVNEEPPEESDLERESSDENGSSDDKRSTDDYSSSDDQSNTDDDDKNDSVWTSIQQMSWTQEVEDAFDEKKAELMERGMSARDAHQSANRHVLANLRQNIAVNYRKKLWKTVKFTKTPSIEKVLATKQKLQEDVDYESEEAIRYAVKKQKYLIQGATGSLSDDELEDDSDDDDDDEDA